MTKLAAMLSWGRGGREDIAFFPGHLQGMTSVQVQSLATAGKAGKDSQCRLPVSVDNNEVDGPMV